MVEVYNASPTWLMKAVLLEEESLRSVIMQAVKSKIAASALMSTLGYYDAYTTERMPTNLIQAQRDCFGAHTYQRIDKEGTFHTEWN